MFPHADEGELTMYRGALVQNAHFAVLAEVRRISLIIRGSGVVSSSIFPILFRKTDKNLGFAFVLVLIRIQKILNQS